MQKSVFTAIECVEKASSFFFFFFDGRAGIYRVGKKKKVCCQMSDVNSRLGNTIRKKVFFKSEHEKIFIYNFFLYTYFFFLKHFIYYPSIDKTIWFNQSTYVLGCYHPSNNLSNQLVFSLTIHQPVLSIKFMF